MNITITDNAASEIISQASAKGRLPILRIGLIAGGCHGFQYRVEWGEELPTENDQVFENSGAKVYVDKKSLIYLNGTVVDFETSLMGRGFKLESPLSTGECGCKESVSF